MRYSKYPSYRDSGVEWLGDIPEHWQLATVSRLFDIKAGGDVKKEYFSEEQSSDYPYPIYTNSTKKSAVYGYSKKSFFHENTITVSGRGYIGYAIYREHKYDAIIRLLVLSPRNKKPCKIFMYYINNVLDFQVANTAISQLSTEQISPYKLVLPPLQEQQTIANYLDIATAKIDTLIEKQTRLIELLQEKRQAVISTAVTRGLDPSVPMKDSGVEWLGEIPEGWVFSSLKRGLTLLTDFEANGSFADVKSNVTLDSNDKYAWYLRATDLENKRKSNKRTCDEKSYKFLRKTSLYGKELLVAKRGEIGKIYITPTIEGKATLAPNLYLLRMNNRLDSKFAYYWYLSDYGRPQLLLANKSTTIGALYKDDVKDCRIVYPLLEEQQVIVNYLDDKTSKIDNLISKSTKAIDLLKEKRTALISAVVTGKIDVRAYLKEIADEL